MSNPNKNKNQLIYELETLRREIVTLKRKEREREQRQIVNKVALLIHQCLNLDDILQITVTEVRNQLQCDRVIIYQFRQNKSLGFVAKESVIDPAFSIINTRVEDSCFEERWIERYYKGRVRAINDIYAEPDMVDCYLEFLESLQIRANLVLPIINNNFLWGLLVLHHCTEPKYWQLIEIELMRELAIQVGIAVQQTELVAKLTKESTERKQAELALQKMNQELEGRIKQSTASLVEMNQRLQQELSDRLDAEKALQDREVLLRGIGDNVPKGFIYQYIQELDGSRYFSYLSAGVEQVTGFTAEQLLADISVWDNLVLKEDLEILRRESEESMQNLSVFDVEVRRKSHKLSDKIIWVRLCSTPRRLENGNTVWDGVQIDITDIKRTEAKLRQNKAFLAEAQKIAHIGNWSYNLITQKVTWTDELFKIFNRDPALEEPNFEEAFQLCYSEDRENLKQAAEHTIKTGEPYKLIFRHIKPDASTIYIEAIGKLEFNHKGEAIRLYGTAQDVTERKQAEIDLEEFNQRWRSLLNNVQLIVMELDNQGNVIYINPFFEQLTGFTSEEAISKNFVKNFVPSRLQSSLMLADEKILTQGINPDTQNEILTKSGETKMIAWKNTFLQDVSGQITGSISIGEDITERYHLEKMKSEFISIVSHELRTPLTAIQASLSLLSEKIIDSTTPAGEKVIQIAADGVDRLVRLVNDILDLERLESGKIHLEKVPCDTANLINTAVSEIQDMATHNGIRIEATPLSFQIKADGDRLVQVLINLLSNAIKFSPNDSTVWLTVELIDQDNPKREQLKFNLQENRPDFNQLSSFVLFTVRDQGRGIPSKQLEQIFERFQQVDASDSREKGGTGLGLAICSNIIEQHGGKIWAESVLGKGSIFYFTIPIQEETNFDK